MFNFFMTIKEIFQLCKNIDRNIRCLADALTYIRDSQDIMMSNIKILKSESLSTISKTDSHQYYMNLMENIKKIQLMQDNDNNSKQSLLWKQLQDENVLFSLNVFLKPYNYSIAISIDGQPILYNQAKEYSQEEIMQLIEKGKNKNV